MWKSLISTSQRASRAAPRSHPTASIGRTSLPTTGPCSFSAVPSLRKDENEKDQFLDRESLKPERTEGTKSGTDNEVAQQPSAYDPSNTAPESELEATGKEQQKEGDQRNPLNMSAANPEVSAWRAPTEGGADRNANRESSSRRGHPKKSRTIHVKEDGTHVSYR